VGDHDEQLFLAGFGQARVTFVVAIARGVLIERYQISAELAGTLLDSRAAAAGISSVEAARRLLRTKVLPT
jgi:hypothetical protein